MRYQVSTDTMKVHHPIEMIDVLFSVQTGPEEVSSDSAVGLRFQNMR